MSAPFLLDLSHTSHTRARTGVQRVTRSLYRALGRNTLAITHDPHRAMWRPLEPWEDKNLTAESTTTKRGSTWPLSAKLRGLTRRWLAGSSAGRPPDTALPSSAGLIVPEVFTPTTAAALPDLLAATMGPRIAVFHDAIALKFPELSPAGTVARFPAYLVELLAFDGVAAVSEDSRDSLRDYWRWLGIAHPPATHAIPLGVDLPPTPNADAVSLAPPRPILLSVGTLEGRKNHLALLEACERLWSDGVQFELHLIGFVQSQTGRAALDRLRALQSLGFALRYDGPASESDLATAYRRCTFTVYPSLTEGFGLPVIESLAYGKPCVCSARGALGESARGGGCVALDTVDATHLADALRRLIAHPAEIAALAASARARKFRTWSDYADDLTAWMRGLKRRT